MLVLIFLKKGILGIIRKVAGDAKILIFPEVGDDPLIAKVRQKLKIGHRPSVR